MIYADLPAAATVFVDASVFIHHFELPQLAFLFCAAVVLFPFARRLLPRVVFLFRPSAVRCTFEEGPEGLASHAGSGDTNELLKRLEQLGFTPLGVKVEYLPLWGRMRELALASAEAKTFASIFAPGQFARPCFYFYTPFQDGAIVQTADDYFSPIERPGFLISVIPATTPRELLELHRRFVDRMTEAGHRPFDDFSPESRLKATQLFYASDEVRRLMRRNGFVSLLILAGLVVLLVAVARLFG